MSRRPRRKAGPRRRYANRSGGLVVSRLNTLVPDRMIMKFSYKDNVNLSSTSGPFASKVFRLNSIYDPDTSVTNGHQPLGFDQWKVFYNKYRVYKALVRVTFINNQAGAIQCGIVPYNAQLSPTYDDSIFEQPHTVSKTAGGTNGSSKVVVTKMIDIPRILGQSHIQYKSSETVASQYEASPGEQVYGAVVLRQVNDSANPNSMAVVDITYFVELFDRTRQEISVPRDKLPDNEFTSPSMI